jgi:hypothetical protein
MNDIDSGRGTIQEEGETDETSPPETQDPTQNEDGGRGPPLHDAQSNGTDPTPKQKTNKTRRTLEPQHPGSDPLKTLPFTPTERRLSGITRAPRQTGTRPFPKTGNLKTAVSTPNLATFPIPKYSNSLGSKSGGASPEYMSTSGSEYGYYTIKELMTPRPLNVLRFSQTSQKTSEIPEQCFYEKEVKLLGDEVYSINSKRRKTLFVSHYYLNSVLYMQSFGIIFVDKIGASLGFTRALDSATAQGPKILCDITQINHDSKPIKIRHEIFPTIKSANWPEQAVRWKTRKRNVTQSSSMPGVQYTWPTQAMMEEMEGYGCHLLPVGYMPTRGKNGEQFMEWQLAFPEAERYLEARLTHPQVRCFLFTMALYKSFLEPLNTHMGLLPSHIRTLLFWQCERGHAKWPEDRPGNILLKFLDTLYEAMKHMRLDDYFIHKRNLFESTPRKHLLMVQEKLLRIRENPVMHVLIALRNLRYIDTTFYPALDFKKLYDIITHDRQPPNPRPQQSITPNTTPSQQQQTEDEESDEEPDSTTDLWKGINKTDREKQWKKDARTQIELERASQRLFETKAKAAAPKLKGMATDSIDIQV